MKHTQHRTLVSTHHRSIHWHSEGTIEPIDTVLVFRSCLFYDQSNNVFCSCKQFLDYIRQLKKLNKCSVQCRSTLRHLECYHCQDSFGLPKEQKCLLPGKLGPSSGTLISPSLFVSSSNVRLSSVHLCLKQNMAILPGGRVPWSK